MMNAVKCDSKNCPLVLYHQLLWVQVNVKSAI